MLDYLFLIPTSPNLAEGSLRRDLQKLCFEQVAKLESSFVVWLLGDAEINHPHFKAIDCRGTTKEEKLKEAGAQLADLPQLAKYLVRLDDDDLINTDVFDKMASRDFDIAYDRKHFFYDLATDLASAQKREWIPNTAIMKYEKAMTKVELQSQSARTERSRSEAEKRSQSARTERSRSVAEERSQSARTERSRSVAEVKDGKNYLFACDHSRAWHPFFEGTQIIHSKDPVYARILNPASITAAASGEFSENNYIRYLEGFGTWKATLPDSLVPIKTDLMKIREKQFGEPLKFKPKRGLFSRLR